MKTECVIYCRVSSERQALGDGLRRQLNTCEKYAFVKDYRVVAVFSEVASGVDDLPVRATAQRVAANRGCKIICENYDRWTRQGLGDVPPSYVEIASIASRVLDAQLEAAINARLNESAP